MSYYALSCLNVPYCALSYLIVIYRALQVRLGNQESEVVGLLKRIPLSHAELEMIRERAEQLRDGTLRSRGEAHLPLMLATFIFESLCLPCETATSASGKWEI